MRGKAHDPALRAKVVAELVTGNAPTDVAERYDLPIQTVTQWKSEATTEFVRSDDVRARARVDLGLLVLDLVADSIATLRVQSQFARNTGWLEKQEISGLADYRSAEYDRIIRLIAAFTTVRRDGEPISDGNERALAAESGAAD